MPKRLVTGTNADLRKLPLKEAKEICREYGVKEEEVRICNFELFEFAVKRQAALLVHF